MSFLAALVTNILEKLFTWFYKVISNDIKQKAEAKKADEDAVKNEKKIEQSDDDLDRHNATEDLLNGNQ